MSVHTPLPESRRQHYLNAMGVQSWYPRMRLPGAPEPLLFDLDDSDDPVPVQAAGAAAVAADRPTPAPVQARVAVADSVNATSQALPAEPTAQPTPAPAEEAAPKSNTAPAVPRFILSLSVVGRFVIADTLARGLEQPTPAGQQLLINILATLGVSADEVRTHHVIQWPLFTNPRVDQGLTQARLYVDEKLQQFIRQYEPRQLLSFGAVLPKLHDWQQPTGDHLGLPWVGLPSLYRMLKDPRQKAVAWQRLKPLVPGDA